MEAQRGAGNTDIWFSDKLGSKNILKKKLQKYTGIIQRKLTAQDKKGTAQKGALWVGSSPIYKFHQSTSYKGTCFFLGLGATTLYHENSYHLFPSKSSKKGTKEQLEPYEGS